MDVKERRLDTSFSDKQKEVSHHQGEIKI